MPDDKLDKTHSEIFKEIGKKIAKKRKQKRRKIQGISKKLNISTVFLDIIEGGDFLKMPRHVPRLGFVKSYARYLNVDISSELSKLNSLKIDTSKNKSEFFLIKVLKILFFLCFLSFLV